MFGDVLDNTAFQVSFSIAALLSCSTCMVYMLLHHRTDRLQSKIFFALTVGIALGACSDMASILSQPHMLTSTVAERFVRVSDYLYFVVHTTLAPLFFLYVYLVCGGSTARNTARTTIATIPFVIVEAMVLLNPLAHWVYYYGPNVEYMRNWGVYVIYIVAALYLGAAFVFLMLRWRAITQMKRRAMMYFFIVAGVGIFVQLVSAQIRVELFAESMGLIGVMMFVESEEGFIDPEYQVYNRHALKAHLDMLNAQNRTLSVIAIRVTNAESFARLGGSLATRSVALVVPEYLKTIMPWYHVYRMSPTRFVLLDPNLSSEEARTRAFSIARRFEEGWAYRDVEINLHASIALAYMPRELKTPQDVFYLVDTPVPMMTNKLVLEGEDLDYIMRRAEVERAVQSGFDAGAYEVYYQPIFDSEGNPRAAEALMRLHDDVLGDISPMEFISVAERIGLIERIGEYALREVCTFMASGVPSSLGVDRISVNLSVVQCMKSEFTSHVEEVVSEYGVNPRTVTFEITETVASANYDFLSRVVDELSRDGHLFAMDDYGTGYSNMHSLMSLDFDLVKIDKSVLWDAEDSNVGRFVLENSVAMMRQVGRFVLVEGVETEEQLNLLRSLGVDYYQGYYFARPMPQTEFVEFLKAC